MKPRTAIIAAVLLIATGITLLSSGSAPAPHGPEAPPAAVAQAPRVNQGITPAPDSPTTPTPEVPQASAASSSPATPTGAAQVSADPVESPALAPGDGPDADGAVQQMLERSSAPNMPPEQERLLEEIGRQVWLADLTGTGRDRWPRYFAAAGSSGFTAVRVQAAIARADGPGRATVTLLWAGTSPAGEPAIALPGTVRFTRQTNGTWEPTR